MAAVQEHQFGHRTHGLDLGGPEEGVAGQHNAAFGAQHAVPRHVHDAVGPLKQCTDDGAGIVFAADQRAHLVSGQAIGGTGQPCHHGQRLGTGAGQRRVQGVVAHRLADHQHAVIGVGVRHLGAEVFGAQLAQQLAANRPRARVTAALRCGIRIQQLPRDHRRALVKLNQHF